MHLHFEKKIDDVYHDWVSHGWRDFEIRVNDIEDVNDKMLMLSRPDCTGTADLHTDTVPYIMYVVPYELYKKVRI